MRQSSATIQTTQAHKLLTILCLHFSEKVPIKLEDTWGEVEFQPGTCRMEATEKTLTISAKGDDEDTMERVQHIVTDHLLRFGRNPNLCVDWIHQG